MGVEYVVVHSDSKSAEIFQDNQEKGMLKKANKSGVFELEAAEPAKKWILTSKVRGELRPFSIGCYSNCTIFDKDGIPADGELCLRIKDHMFFHHNNFYSVGGAIPIGGSQGDFLSGSKYICRLVNFPFSQIEDVDEQTKHQMKRHRGIAVGDIQGLGADGYHVKIYGDELADIGLLLATCTYLLYTTR